MAAPIYLGDEVSAAGWRLAGATVRTPVRGAATALLAWACAQAPLVVLSAAVAADVDADTLADALAALAPLVVVVPALDDRAALPDVAARLRGQLGLEA